MKIPTRMPSAGGVFGCDFGIFWVFEFWGLRFVKIPTRMPSGVCILGICILGVAIRENPDTYAFWGLHFGYLHSGGCDS